MWLINLIPGDLYSTFIIIGFLIFSATYFLKALPLFSAYVIPIQLLSVAVLIFGVYGSGVTASEREWEKKVEKLNNEIQLAEEKARSASARVEYVFVDRIQKVKDTQIVIQEKLKDITVTIDSQCKVSPLAIDLVNSAAKNTAPK